jgi:hypothetical protein
VEEEARVVELQPYRRMGNGEWRTGGWLGASWESRGKERSSGVGGLVGLGFLIYIWCVLLD